MHTKEHPTSISEIYLKERHYYISVIPDLLRRRQDNLEFKSNLDYTDRICPQRKKATTTRESVLIQVASKADFLSCFKEHRNRPTIETRRIQFTTKEDGICSW